MRRTHEPPWRHLVVLAFLVATPASYGRDYTPEECPAIGNAQTRIYHVAGDPNYRQMLVENKKAKTDNRVCFKSLSAAEEAGYRRSLSDKSKKAKR
jgi:hypothetical protein